MHIRKPGSDILVTDLTIADGGSIASEPSGTINIGSPTNPFGTLYADNIVSSNTSGTFVSKYGDTMTGDLTMDGANIIPSASGENTIGSLGNPFEAIYADNIFSVGLDDRYVLKTGDTMTGTLNTPSISNPIGNLEISGETITEDADQINLTSHNGPIILNADTEVQIESNGLSQMNINPSGIGFGANTTPNITSTYDLGSPSLHFRNIYADNIIAGSGSETDGEFVHRSGDTMYGDLIIEINVEIPTNVSKDAEHHLRAFAQKMGQNVKDGSGFFDKIFG